MEFNFVKEIINAKFLKLLEKDIYSSVWDYSIGYFDGFCRMALMCGEITEEEYNFLSRASIEAFYP